MEREIEREREILRYAYQRIHPRDAHFAEALRAAPPPLHIYRAVLAALLLSEPANRIIKMILKRIHTLLHKNLIFYYQS